MDLVGLHTHIGTFVQDPQAYGAAASKMAGLANELRARHGTRVSFIDLGGGFASPNTLKSQYLDGQQASPPFSRYAEAICAGLSELDCPAAQMPTLVLETGRALVDEAGSLVSMLVWFAFGALAIPIVLVRADLAVVAYAILSLTLVRMVPVALACWGAGLDRKTVLFVGWFGPRGLASLVFALLALEDLGTAADDVVAIIGVTVLLSVLAHGLSASPLAARYGKVTTERT